MGIDSLFRDCYVVCVYSHWDPYGRMVASYHTEEEAQNHIKYQRTHMGNTDRWNVLHIKDLERIPEKKDVEEN